MLKKFFKKVTGLQALEDAKEQALAEAKAAVKLAAQSTAEAEAAKAAEEAAKLGPKERATLKGESWVGVLDTKVNPDNPRNGFFELDWNDLFIVQLKKAGYGFDGDPDEEIVDRWFRDLATSMLVEAGQNPNRGAGFININRLPGGKAEVE